MTCGIDLFSSKKNPATTARQNPLAAPHPSQVSWQSWRCTNATFDLQLSFQGGGFFWFITFPSRTMRSQNYQPKYVLTLQQHLFHVFFKHSNKSRPTKKKLLKTLKSIHPKPPFWTFPLSTKHFLLEGGGGTDQSQRGRSVFLQGEPQGGARKLGDSSSQCHCRWCFGTGSPVSLQMREGENSQPGWGWGFSEEGNGGNGQIFDSLEVFLNSWSRNLSVFLDRELRGFLGSVPRLSHFVVDLQCSKPE